MKKITLFEQTLGLMEQSTIPIASLCRELKVTERWYYKLLAGDIKDPSVNRIQRLHDYLAANRSDAA